MGELEATKVRNLVAKDRLEDAAAVLEQGLGSASVDDRSLLNDVVAVQAELARLTRDARRRSIRRSELNDARRRLSFELLEILDAGVAAVSDSKPRTVFLSYSHADSAAAQAVRTHLEAHGVSVVIDDETLQPGEILRDFIRRSIRDTEATVLVVSESSLTSTWVALETALALAGAEIAGRRFISCYLDESLFRAGFHREAVSAIDDRIGEIDQERQHHTERGTAAPALEDERIRLLDLRHHLGRILQRLQGSLCLDIRAPVRSASLDRLVASLERRDP